MPEIIHVGFSKCASTFLRSFFREHPQTHLVSEAHFFVPFERCHFSRGAEYYAGLFKDAAPGQLKVESDEHIVLPLLHPVLRAAATTIEAIQQASERVKAVSPDSKIILVIRNQLDLILSRYGEYIMTGRNIDFEQFVYEFLNSSTDNKNYYQNYYSKIIKILRSTFSPQNVLVIIQEELFKNEIVVLQQLCEFVGIEQTHVRSGNSHSRIGFLSLDHFRVVARSGKRSKNAGLSYTGIKIMRIWNRLLVLEAEEAYYQKARTRAPYAVYKFGVRAIRVVDYYLPTRLKGNKKSLLTSQVVSRIQNEFAEDNCKLEQMLDKNLGQLGY